MHDYMGKAMDRLQHPKPKRPQYEPHSWSFTAYGKRLKMSQDPNESTIIWKMATKRIQSIMGTMLYYVQSLNPMMLQAIDENL